MPKPKAESQNYVYIVKYKLSPGMISSKTKERGIFSTAEKAWHFIIENLTVKSSDGKRYLKTPDHFVGQHPLRIRSEQLITICGGERYWVERAVLDEGIPVEKQDKELKKVKRAIMSPSQGQLKNF